MQPLDELERMEVEGEFYARTFDEMLVKVKVLSKVKVKVKVCVPKVEVKSKGLSVLMVLFVNTIKVLKSVSLSNTAPNLKPLQSYSQSLSHYWVCVTLSPLSELCRAS
jgi:hypothetical protein